jgi:hypothetical protein
MPIARPELSRNLLKFVRRDKVRRVEVVNDPLVEAVVKEDVGLVF